jgi:hypothetical protein
MVGFQAQHADKGASSCGRVSTQLAQQQPGICVIWLKRKKFLQKSLDLFCLTSLCGLT